MTDEQTISNSTTKKQWGVEERAAWLATQKIQRSYRDDVLIRINSLSSEFDVVQYGALTYDPTKYPLFLLRTRDWDPAKKTVLITGGVHGYETSGVMGALTFLETEAKNYSNTFNILVAPCVSPWGYETINRWNPNAIDPNRSFSAESEVEEPAALIKAISTIDLPSGVYVHIDLHETTDTDNSIFMPTKAERDAEELVIWEIPDGFYTVGDTESPEHEFQTAIIQSVEKVTHIAPADSEGNIIGEPTTQKGVINYEKSKLGLCAGYFKGRYRTTTEVYPDSPTATPEDCIKAQVAAIKGGLNYAIEQL